MTPEPRKTAEIIVDIAERARFDETAYFSVIDLINEIEKALTDWGNKRFEEGIRKASKISEFFRDKRMVNRTTKEMTASGLCQEINQNILSLLPKREEKK